MPELPQVRWSPASVPLGSDNCVLVAQSRRHSVRDYPGPLSIKTVTKGRIAWRTGRRDIWVDESTFLVLNNGEPYSMEIDAIEPVSTCCVFFKPSFVEHVVRDLSASDDHCLGNPEPPSAEVFFLNRLHTRTAALDRRIAEIRNALKHNSSHMHLEECYLGLAVQLALQLKETRKELGAIPAVRPSTRLELLTRVSRGRDYLHACPNGMATLADAARAAAMSPFHFQRTFKTAFGLSPSRYVGTLRFTRAATLLRAGMNVTDTAHLVGFSSSAAFSTAFRQWCGAAPSKYAAQFRKISNAPPT